MFPIPSATESESASPHRYFPGVEFFPPRDANSVGAVHRDNLPAPCAPPSHVRAGIDEIPFSALHALTSGRHRRPSALGLLWTKRR